MANELKVKPLVATAFPLNEIKNDTPMGQLFCFLPLPMSETSPTGLNVHVNGYFSLDQNRRHLKLPSADLDSNHWDQQLQWNMDVLIGELIPISMSLLIEAFAENEPIMRNMEQVFIFFQKDNI